MQKIIQKIIVVVMLAGMFFPLLSFATSTIHNVQTFPVSLSDITDVTAVLKGSVSINSGAVGYAYFRYSKVIDKPPVFCNDIYGSNMVSIKAVPEKITGTGATVNFSATLQHLTLSTTYSYCAVVSNSASNPTEISSSQTVGTFNTKVCQTCDQTDITTTYASSIDQTSALLNGNYNFTLPVKTYFKYRTVTPVSGVSVPNYGSWIRVGDEDHTPLGSCPIGWSGTYPVCVAPNNTSGICQTNWTGIYPNCTAPTIGIYGNINFFLSNLTPATNYQFMAAAEAGSTAHPNIISTFGEDPSNILDFTTNSPPITPTPPTPDTCQDATALNFGDQALCIYGSCPTGWTGTYPTCIAPSTGSCPEGWVGIYPNCTNPDTSTCPTGWTGTWPFCTAPTTCPTGWTGTPPDCVNPNPGVCPTGWTGTPPDCIQPNTGTCPYNWTGTWPNCIAPGGPTTCPTGWTGIYPNCTNPNPGSCPAGWTGTYPVCTAPTTCQTGWTGIYPNCTNPNPGSCPAGWTGTYPVCTAPTTCPTGWTGTYPFCTNPNPGSCPAGWSGTYPFCTNPNPGSCLAGWSGTYPVCTAPHNCPAGWTGTYPVCTAPNNIPGVCPILWTGTYPVCTAPNNIPGVCPTNWTGIYPVCTAPMRTGARYIDYVPGPNKNKGTITNTNVTKTNIPLSTAKPKELKIGTIATPPVDATVHYGEGVETVFARQIVANQQLAKMYGYTADKDLKSFAWMLSDILARTFGYVGSNGKEIRVSKPDVAAYQLEIVAKKLTVYEYYNSKIVNIQKITSSLKNAYDYEYYFRKK